LLGVVGSPTAIDVLSSRIAEAGTNYLMCRMVFGDVPLAESPHSIELFAKNVMPASRISADARVMA
jgi:hypothetical protein